MRSVFGFVVLLGLAALVAIFWFRTPDTDVAALERKYAQPPSQFITLPLGERVHYRVQGNPNGRTLLLLHGTSDSLYTWKPWVRELGSDDRIITLDLPGHGLTGPVPGCDYSIECFVRVLHEFTSAMDLDDFVIGGNSLGGNVAWRYVLSYPKGIDGLVLVDASGVPQTTQAPTTLAFRLGRIPVVNRVLELVTPRDLVEKGLTDAVAKDGIITEAMVDRFWELGRRPGNRHALVMRINAHDTNAAWRDKLRHVHIPVLILWGREDTFVDVSAGDWFARAMPQAIFTVYDHVGHLPQLEVPHSSAMDVHNFMANLAVAAPAEEAAEVGPAMEPATESTPEPVQ